MPISAVGAVHLTAALAALAFGALVLAMRKGTPLHRSIGAAYVFSMLGVNLTALSLYRLTGHFGPFHALALVSLAGVGIAVAAVTLRWRSWLVAHYRAMSYSYIGLLAATTAEALVRVPALRVHTAAGGIGLGVTVTLVFVIVGRIVVRRLQPVALRAPRPEMRLLSDFR